VVAPDQRGYGRTLGWDARYDGDLASFRMTNLVDDALALVAALGVVSAAAVVGHDFGSPVAAWCALLYPQVFRSVVLMSAPFAGPPGAVAPAEIDPIDAQLAALPRPRKHYQRYYCGADANANLWRAPQGVHAFLRAYYHHKSADWPGNRPHALRAWSASELAQLPTYYVMDLAVGMAETVAQAAPSPAQVTACRWLPDAELSHYSSEYERTGFQGGLQWYRCAKTERYTAELRAHAGRTIAVPSMFIAGSSDWGVYQKPGDFEAMQSSACTAMRAVYLVDGAGHWVQQEQPEAVSRLLLRFLRAPG
jgi:pimeloyl-ACP methyl ester carboxylesterase